MNGDETKDENVKVKTSGKNKRKIVLIAIVVIIVIIAIIGLIVSKNVTNVVAEDNENYATLKVNSNGVYELTVVNYVDEDTGEQNLRIQKTDEYGNPLQGVEFAIDGNFRTSYTVEYYNVDSGKILSDYTQTFYGSHWDSRIISTDEKGEISLTLQYGDYAISEYKTVYGYEEDDSIYWIRVDKNGISSITESQVDWSDANFDEKDLINVSTAAIEDKLGSIEYDLDYELSYIMLNSNKLGTAISALPSTVSDGDVIKIYVAEGGKIEYTIAFYVYEYGHFSNLEYLGDITETCYKSDTFDLDGTACIEIDIDYIDEILVELGATDYIAFVYGQTFFETYLGLAESCGGLTTEDLDGMDDWLLTYLNAYWQIGNTKSTLTVNTEYTIAGDDIYVFVVVY